MHLENMSNWTLQGKFVEHDRIVEIYDIFGDDIECMMSQVPFSSQVLVCSESS